MSGYEEMVVDREVDAAWTTFRQQAADVLAELEPGYFVTFDPDADDPDLPTIDIECTDDGDLVASVPGFSSPHDVEIDDQLEGHLIDLGFAHTGDGHMIWQAPVSYADMAAWVATVLLHQVWGAVHPAFVTVEGAPELQAPEPDIDDEGVDGPLPDLIHPESPDDVRRWVGRIVAEQTGHEPRWDDDGDLPVQGSGGAHGWITFDRRGRVTVSTCLATRARPKLLRRELERLAGEHRSVAFMVQGSSLYASRQVDTRPLVPDHLLHAVRAVLRISAREGRDLSRRLSNTLREKAPADAIDPVLAAIAADARHHGDDLEAIFEQACDDSPDRCVDWLQQARAAKTRSRDAMQAAAADDPMYPVHRRDWLRWVRVVATLELVMGLGHEVVDDATDR